MGWTPRKEGSHHELETNLKPHLYHDTISYVCGGVLTRAGHSKRGIVIAMEPLLSKEGGIIDPVGRGRMLRWTSDRGSLKITDPSLVTLL